MEADHPKPFHRDTLEYSKSTLAAMPLRLNSLHRRIMRLDISGRKPGQISEEVGITASRISVIQASDLYKVERRRMEEQVNELFREEVAERDAGDPIRKFLTAEAFRSAETLVELRDGAKAELVRRQSAVDILDRAGYKVPKEEVRGEGPVEVGEGLANAIRQAILVMQQNVKVTVNMAAPAPVASAAQPSSPVAGAPEGGGK